MMMYDECAMGSGKFCSKVLASKRMMPARLEVLNELPIGKLTRKLFFPFPFMFYLRTRL